MGTIPLLLAAGLYLWVAVAYWRTGQRGNAAAFIGYALANVGFAFDLWRAK